MTDQNEPTVTESGAEPELTEHEQAKRDFVKARNRRNIMIAWSLVAFMAIVFSITAIRLTQNLADREAAMMAEEEVSGEALAEE